MKNYCRMRKYCIDCNKINPEGYMVTNEIWDAIGLKKRDGFLCFECLETRMNKIGINLQIDSFTSYPINDSIRFGYKIGKTNSKGD